MYYWLAIAILREEEGSYKTMNLPAVYTKCYLFLIVAAKSRVVVNDCVYPYMADTFS